MEIAQAVFMQISTRRIVRVECTVVITATIIILQTETVVLILKTKEAKYAELIESARHIRLKKCIVEMKGDLNGIRRFSF